MNIDPEFGVRALKVSRLGKFGFALCSHVIVNIPADMCNSL
jgi:radical SAM superfamily enzyme